MQYTLSILVANRPGVLTRVTSLVARRGFNIESLAVGITEDPTRSRITLVVEADKAEALEQITKQLHKLVDVYKITDLTIDESIDRELVLYKVSAAPEKRHEIIEVANVFRAKIVDLGRTTLTIEATGTADKLNALENVLRSYGVKAIVRTGKIALARGGHD